MDSSTPIPKEEGARPPPSLSLEEQAAENILVRLENAPELRSKCDTALFKRPICRAMLRSQLALELEYVARVHYSKGRADGLSPDLKKECRWFQIYPIEDITEYHI